MPTPLDLERPNSAGNTWGEMRVFQRGQVRLHPSVSKIFGTPTHAHMTRSNQILHGDQTRRGERFYRVHLAKSVLGPKDFVIRVLTRDLFAVAKTFLFGFPRYAMRKRDFCCGPVSVRLSVRHVRAFYLRNDKRYSHIYYRTSIGSHMRSIE